MKLLEFFEGEPTEVLVKHHLEDIAEALEAAERALADGDLREVVDSAVIMQSSAIDVEELITKKKVQV